MRVYLLCRYGNHMPSPTKAVEFKKDIAEKLISSGHAVEAKEDADISVSKTITALESEKNALQVELSTLNIEYKALIKDLASANAELEKLKTAAKK